MVRVILCWVWVQWVSEFISSNMFLFLLWKYLVICVQYCVVCRCISGVLLVGEVIIMECLRFFLLRILLMNFFILWFCLLIRLMMMMLVLVKWVIIFSSIDLFILVLVNRLRCWLWLIVSRLLIEWMLMLRGLLIGWCLSGLIVGLFIGIQFLVCILFLLLRVWLVLLSMWLSIDMFIGRCLVFGSGMICVLGVMLVRLLIGIRYILLLEKFIILVFICIGWQLFLLIMLQWLLIVVCKFLVLRVRLIMCSRWFLIIGCVGSEIVLVQFFRCLVKLVCLRCIDVFGGVEVDLDVVGQWMGCLFVLLFEQLFYCLCQVCFDGCVDVIVFGFDVVVVGQ